MVPLFDAWRDRIIQAIKKYPRRWRGYFYARVSISRILYRAKLDDDHLSGIRIATNLKRPYGLAPDRCLPRLSSPTVPRELLPHDFTLASRGT